MEGEGDSPTETVTCVVNVCTICEKKYKQKKGLYKHLRSNHNIEPLSKKEPQFECEKCEKKFSSKSNLKQHVEKFHGPLLQDQESKRKTRLICSFQECDSKFMNQKRYRTHLQKDHKLNLETEEFCFGSIQEFEHWKKDMESQSFAFYTQDTAKTTLANGNIKVFYNCHRSLNYIKKGENKRAAKSIRSNKINKACPARLDVEVINDKSKVIVKFYKTHCGHETQIGRIMLDKNTRAQIADKLKEGVTFENILDSFHDSHLDNGTLKQIRLLKRKDLHNIVRDFRIDYTTKRHQNDAISIGKVQGEVVRTKWNGHKDSYKKFQKQAEPTGPSDSELPPAIQLVSTTSIPATPMLKIKSETVHVESSQTLSNDTISELKYSTIARTTPAIEPTRPSDPLNVRRSSTTKRSSNKSADDGDRPQLKREKCEEPSEAIDLLFKSYAETFKRLTAKKQILLKFTLDKLFADAQLDEMKPSVVFSSESVADEHDYSLGLDLKIEGLA